MNVADELVRLDIPAQPSFVGVARSVIATVATTLEGLDDDRLEDLRLAVSEVCTSALSVDGIERMVLRCLRDDGHFEVCIEDTGRGLGSEGIAANGFTLQLLNALVDDVTFLDGPDGTAVRLRMVLDPE
jgi:anti-sigma regulatory factor (Ser/Thr protein kinase)